MTPLIASLTSIALITGGLALLLIGPPILLVARYVFGVMFALAALGVALIIAIMSLSGHVATVAGHAPATPEIWTAALLGGSVLALAFWRGRTAPPSLARRVSPRVLTNMARADAPRPPRVAPLPLTPRAAPRPPSIAPLPLTPDQPAAPRPARTASPAVRDAILALCGVGFSKSDAAAAVAAAMAALGPQASLPALIKASLQRTAAA
jgi:RuvA, C-terminal domain